MILLKKWRRIAPFFLYGLIWHVMYLMLNYCSRGKNRHVFLSFWLLAFLYLSLFCLFVISAFGLSVLRSFCLLPLGIFVFRSFWLYVSLSLKKINKYLMYKQSLIKIWPKLLQRSQNGSKWVNSGQKVPKW